MLGVELNKIQPTELSKSSILHEQMDERGLKDLLEEKDKIIRKLNTRIEKLEEQLKRFQSEKKEKDSNREAVAKQNMHLKLLKQEIGKTKRLQEIIDQITQRVNTILEDLSSDNTLTENSEELRQIIFMLETSKNQSLQSEGHQKQNQPSLNISNEWTKKIDILEGTFKSFKVKFKALNGQNKSLTSQIESLQRKVSDLQAKISGNEEVIQITLQLKQQKKQRQKMKRLLEITEFSKNQLINKINSVVLREDIKAKTKQELLQYSKELNYRIKDLEKEKACIIKESTKDKQQQLKKYQEVLKKLKTIKDKSILAKSCA